MSIMTIRIDLSSYELNPDAVVEFIRAHTTIRPTENILFTVSPATFVLYRQGYHSTYVRASPQETAEMNAFLSVSWMEDDYRLDDGVVCQHCKRVLTFYDLFKSGLRRHGDQHMKTTLA